MKTVLTIVLLLCLHLTGSAQRITSQLETYELATGKRTVVHRDTVRFEAPNWTRDGQFLIINQKGKLYRVTIKTGQKEVMDTGFATTCNNDHGLTPDGKTIIVSHHDKGVATAGNSKVYTIPYPGGTPTQITEKAPSYWHGVTPDGKTLAYVGQRTLPDGTQDYDIYTMPTAGGTTETRLTTAPGLDDGPDYSPDGRYIYFNSYRTGKMHVWRMDADGKNPIQLTNDAYSNWFPHPSPDGKQIVFISYLEDQGFAHPADKQVMLRLMDIKTGQIRELARFRGGQGTINVPSWSPDSKNFGFVSYP